ncbi:DUF1749 domain-containing protein [Candidatus Micrarchaeota archaeon]|nr:DUF1749 domain-containing protein [Candidatus Micrarchaeota archaeon]
MAKLDGQLVKTVTSDGIELHGFLADSGSDTAVLHVHGTAGDFYTHEFLWMEAEMLAKMGISFLTTNNRGHDVYTDLRKHEKNGKVAWETIGGAFERFEDCVLDIGAWIDFLEKQGAKRVILQGHSLTHKLVYYQHAKKDPRVIGQIHLSPCNDAGYLNNTLGKERFAEATSLIKKLVAEGRGKEMLPPHIAVVCPMGAMAGYGYLIEDGVGNLFPYHKPDSPNWSSLSKIREPLLVVFGGADEFIRPSIAKQATLHDAARIFKQKASSAASVSTRVIEGSAHSYIGFEGELVSTIRDWLRQTFPAKARSK